MFISANMKMKKPKERTTLVVSIALPAVISVFSTATFKSPVC